MGDGGNKALSNLDFLHIIGTGGGSMWGSYKQEGVEVVGHHSRPHHESQTNRLPQMGLNCPHNGWAA